MKTIKCKQCKGVYYKDNDKNNAIALHISIVKRDPHYTEDDFERMNPNLRANTKMYFHSSRMYLQEHLGDKTFCECMYDKIEEKNKQRDTDYLNLNKVRELSDYELENINRNAENMRLRNIIDDAFNKFM